MRVAINGAGIAGTALAYWLMKMGHEVLLVERAPELRTGGFMLNLWGIGYDAVEKMGLLPRLLELQYQTDELRMVNRKGRIRGGYPSRVLQHLAKGRIATLARADIAAAIHALLDDQVETMFGDSIATIENPHRARGRQRDSAWHKVMSGSHGRHGGIRHGYRVGGRCIRGIAARGAVRFAPSGRRPTRVGRAQRRPRRCGLFD